MFREEGEKLVLQLPVSLRCRDEISEMSTSDSEFLVILADHGVQVFVLTFGALRHKLPLLLLQVPQLALQPLQVQRPAVPQEASGERVHVVEGDARQLPAGSNISIRALRSLSRETASKTGKKQPETRHKYCITKDIIYLLDKLVRLNHFPILIYSVISMK